MPTLPYLDIQPAPGVPQCVVCGDEDTTTDNEGWCDACLEMDRTTNWEEFEENKRRKIAEACEY